MKYIKITVEDEQREMVLKAFLDSLHFKYTIVDVAPPIIYEEGQHEGMASNAEVNILQHYATE